MTSIAAAPVRPSRPASAFADAASIDGALAAVLLAALAFSLALQAKSLIAVWTTGLFYDSDDAMRMVQVRDLLAGQAWFDLVAHRLDPPQGLLSHWSRIVDAPIVALIKGFGLFLPHVAAERAARITFPTLMLAGLYWACAYAARLLAGAGYAIAGVIAATLCGVATWQYIPGRVDHHGPQIFLLVTALAALANSLDPARGRRAAWTGIAIAVSIGISIENLPFIVVMAATPFLAFIMQGERAKNQLVAFALGLGLALPLVFVATIPPSRWLDPARDAYSIIHLTAGLAGAAACLALSRLRLERMASRLAAAVTAGVLVLALVLGLFPDALRDPLAGIDPVLRSFWLEHLQETEPFFVHLRRAPLDGASWLGPFALGFAGAVFGVARSHSIQRGRWLLLVAALMAGGLAATWQMRVVSSTAPLMALGSLGLVAPLRETLARRHAALAGPLVLVALIIACSRLGFLSALSAWTPPPAVMTAPAVAPRQQPPTTTKLDCITSASFAPLAALPPGLAIAPIDVGPDLLAHTPHSIVAAPYHRNNIGNLLALHVFTASPDKAEALVRAAGARWLFVCMGGDQSLNAFTSRAPDGLAARLAKNDAPSWLKPIPLSDTPFRAYEVEALQAPAPTP